jgi:hypothetical protein
MSLDQDLLKDSEATLDALGDPEDEEIDLKAILLRLKMQEAKMRTYDRGFGRMMAAYATLGSITAVITIGAIVACLAPRIGAIKASVESIDQIGAPTGMFAAMIAGFSFFRFLELLAARTKLAAHADGLRVAIEDHRPPHTNKIEKDAPLP